MMKSNRWLRFGALAALLPLAACDTSSLFEVDSPGRIADTDLNNKDAIPGLVAGMSAELADAVGNEIYAFSALVAGELFHGGSYDWADIPRGVILDEDVNNTWEEMHQARWVAEDGIRRMQEEILTDEEFARNPFVARAYFFAGVSNRMLGENACVAVIDGGSVQPIATHFERAEDELTQAITIGQAANNSEVVTAAYGARASVRVSLGDWTGAVEDAAKVPVGFVYLAALNNEDPSNDLYYETHDRFEYTVFDTEFADHPDDPRAPWHIVFNANGSVANGANGATPHYQQDKYKNLGADVPLVKGTEMLLIRAEAALRDNDVARATALMNEARAFYGMDPLAPAATATPAEAWATLHYEKGATTWLETRRLGDLRRWYAESGPAHHSYLEGRDKCAPVSKEEKQANANARG